MKKIFLFFFLILGFNIQAQSDSSFEDSLIIYNQIILKSPTAQAYKKRALIKGVLEDFNGAIRDLTEAIKLNPRDAQLYYSRGFYKVEINLFKEAISDLNTAIQIDPSDPMSYLSRATAQYNIGWDPIILTDYSYAIELSLPLGKKAQPILREAYHGRGVIQIYVYDKLDEGCLDLNKALIFGNQLSKKVVDEFCK